MTNQTSQTKGLVGSVLSPACRVWLRSQVSHVEDLKVDIAGGSMQILGGTIPQINVVAIGAIYQGLSLGSIDLVAENIRVNLPQVIKGQPLGLLEPIDVTAKVKFSESELQASLAAPILRQAITDLLIQILAADAMQSYWQVNWNHVQLLPQTLILRGNLTIDNQNAPIEISMGIAILSGHLLQIEPLSINCSLDLSGSQIASHQINLGDDVDITKLEILAGELLCQGQIRINP